ncbi:FAD-dependent oxidoreductase [Brucella intermedia GD04153]|uniref:Trimethylamine monooxygenase n=1 Tax=Brucella intermedia GD04153 TaxID=2975438 RepID=A0AA42H2F8_9HYPH|nr:FAD-dependent oxidoreductase [Brucella intermedia]MDH0126830.1 FAD-dependent oxidoreductase [Brucella intermedia GD04153]
MTNETVAIIGAGPSGLVAARYLKSQNFVPTVFESHSDIGGQWNIHNPNSGIWPQMRTNTSKAVTKFSDVQYPPHVPMFPRNRDVLAMLNDFANLHDLRSLCRFGVTVTKLDAIRDGYQITSQSGGGTQCEFFDRVVIASGRFNLPEIPIIPGLNDFSGECGVIHAFNYKHPEKYRDKNIVVLGGSISALEVASDQSMMGTGRVYLSQRRQRYVLPKIYAGTPLEYIALTRENGIAYSTIQKSERLEKLKELVLTISGDPSSYGAPKPHESLEQFGLTASQHFLSLVAEDRINVRPWVAEIKGRTVVFTDGTEIEADAIIIATGFDLNLPYISDEIARTINLSTKRMELAEFTFHPDLPGLAFMGMWGQFGAFPVVLEQQARWIAYSWSGAVPAASDAQLRDAVAACIAEDHFGASRQQNELALRFARLAGTDPSEIADPELAQIIDKSAVTGEMFRIVGTDSDPEAVVRLCADFWTFAPAEVRAKVTERFARRGELEQQSPLPATQAAAE